MNEVIYSMVIVVVSVLSLTSVICEFSVLLSALLFSPYHLLLCFLGLIELTIDS